QALFARDPARLGVLGTAGWLWRHAGLVGSRPFSAVAVHGSSPRSKRPSMSLRERAASLTNLQPRQWCSALKTMESVMRHVFLPTPKIVWPRSEEHTSELQ